jgi:hypothetical protein
VPAPSPLRSTRPPPPWCLIRLAAVNELGQGPWSEASEAAACPQLGDNAPEYKALLTVTQLQKQARDGEVALQAVLLQAQQLNVVSAQESAEIKRRVRSGESSEFVEASALLRQFRVRGVQPLRRTEADGTGLRSAAWPEGVITENAAAHPYYGRSNLSPRFDGGVPNRLVAAVRTRPMHALPHDDDDDAGGGGDDDDVAAIERQMRAEQVMALQALDRVRGERDPRQQHGLRLRSVYDRYAWDGEPPLTCAAEEFLGACDYILYSVEKLLPQTMLSVPELEDIHNDDPRELEMDVDGASSVSPPPGFEGTWVRPLKENEAKRHHYLPNFDYPSNHVALMAEFTFKRAFLESLWSEGPAVAQRTPPETPPDPPNPAASECVSECE